MGVLKPINKRLISFVIDVVSDVKKIFTMGALKPIR